MLLHIFSKRYLTLPVSSLVFCQIIFSQSFYALVLSPMLMYSGALPPPPYVLRTPANPTANPHSYTGLHPISTWLLRFPLGSSVFTLTNDKDICACTNPAISEYSLRHFFASEVVSLLSFALASFPAIPSTVYMRFVKSRLVVCYFSKYLFFFSISLLSITLKIQSEKPKAQSVIKYIVNNLMSTGLNGQK